MSDDFFQEILKAANCNFPMCAAAASKASLGVSQAQIKDAGLVDDHCYSIIDACAL